jgi:hypothetical protein
MYGAVGKIYARRHNHAAAAGLVALGDGFGESGAAIRPAIARSAITADIEVAAWKPRRPNTGNHGSRILRLALSRHKQACRRQA